MFNAWSPTQPDEDGVAYKASQYDCSRGHDHDAEIVKQAIRSILPSRKASRGVRLVNYGPVMAGPRLGLDRMTASPTPSAQGAGVSVIR